MSPPDPLLPFLALLLDLVHQAPTLSHYPAKEAKLKADLGEALTRVIDARVEAVLARKAEEMAETAVAVTGTLHPDVPQRAP